MSKLLKIIVFLFLLQTSSFADCRYEASGEVQGDKIINKVDEVFGARFSKSVHAVVKDIADLKSTFSAKTFKILIFKI
jgi:hypothetical protein